MTKQEKKKLSLKELIENKEKFDRKGKGKKRQELYLEELDATIVIEEADTTIITEAQGIDEDGNSESSGNDYIAYNVIVDPNLKDPELQKAYGCVEPIDIVKKLFGPGTTYNIATASADLGGFNHKVTPVEKLKN